MCGGDRAIARGSLAYPHAILPRAPRHNIPIALRLASPLPSIYRCVVDTKRAEQFAVNPWRSPQGLATLISRMRWRISAGILGRPRRRDLQRQ